jgi:hypothetical protein
MTFSTNLLARCSTATQNTPTSFVIRFQTVDAAATFVETVKNELKCVVDPSNSKVVYINFDSERKCTEFGAALAPYREPELTPVKGKPAPVFDEYMLPPLPEPTAGLEPIVSVFLFASAKTVIPQRVRIDIPLPNGVKLCVGDVPVSAISEEDREDSKGTHKVKIGPSVFSLSTTIQHRLSTSHAIECMEKWQRAKQADEQALETWKKDCAAMREIFLVRGKYLTTMPYSGRTKHLTLGQEPVLYRIPASAPAPAPASAQVVALSVAIKSDVKSVRRCRNTSWVDDEDVVVETTDGPAKPVMSEMELLMREMNELEESNKATEASIESAIEAQKAAEESIANEKALVAMRSQRDALVAKQLQLKATKEALQAATQALRSA